MRQSLHDASQGSKLWSAQCVYTGSDLGVPRLDGGVLTRLIRDRDGGVSTQADYPKGARRRFLVRPEHGHVVPKPMILLHSLLFLCG
jgi:hypothetical protein